MRERSSSPAHELDRGEIKDRSFFAPITSSRSSIRHATRRHASTRITSDVSRTSRIAQLQYLVAPAKRRVTWARPSQRVVVVASSSSSSSSVLCCLDVLSDRFPTRSFRFPPPLSKDAATDGKISLSLPRQRASRRRMINRSRSRSSLPRGSFVSAVDCCGCVM